MVHGQIQPADLIWLKVMYTFWICCQHLKLGRFHTKNISIFMSSPDKWKIWQHMGPHSWIATYELEMKYVAYGEKAESLTFTSSPENGCFRHLCLFHCSQFRESNNTECWEKLGKQRRNSEWSAPCHTSSSCPTAYHLPDNALGIRGGKNQKQTEKMRCLFQLNFYSSWKNRKTSH